MELEWDDAKRNKTLEERGLDFADVAQLEWDTAIIFDDERHNYGERRKTALGFLDGRLVVIAFTERNNNLRIISMRKANDREEKIYDKF